MRCHDQPVVSGRSVQRDLSVGVAEANVPSCLAANEDMLSLSEPDIYGQRIAVVVSLVVGGEH
jgi:hypothetical protein